MSTGCPANRNPYARLLPLQDQLCRVARGWRELERERFDGRAQRLRSYPAGAHIPRAHLGVDGHTPSLDGAVDDDLPAGCAGDHVQGVRPRLHPHAGDLGGERYVDARGFVGAEPPRLVERDQPAHGLAAARRRPAVAQFDGPTADLHGDRVQRTGPLSQLVRRSADQAGERGRLAAGCLGLSRRQRRDEQNDPHVLAPEIVRQENTPQLLNVPFAIPTLKSGPSETMRLKRSAVSGLRLTGWERERGMGRRPAWTSLSGNGCGAPPWPPRMVGNARRSPSTIAQRRWPRRSLFPLRKRGPVKHCA